MIKKLLAIFLPTTLIICLSLALLWHLSNIWIYGEHFIVEPNRVILIIDTALLGSIFLYGVWLLVTRIREIR